MKKITGFSLILVLLLFVSTFSNVNALHGKERINSLTSTLPIDVSKKVWNGEEWADTATHYFGESVLFNFTITYNKNCEDGLWATEIKAIDILPSFLEYNRSLNYKPDFINGNTIYWNLTEVYGIFLEDNESISIEFEAIVTDYGEDINFVEVTAWETGCDNNLYGSDDAEIIIADPLLVKKEVYDPIADEWVDEYFGSVTKTNPIFFRINITYAGYYDVKLMKCMIVEDFLPDCCLEYIGNEEFTYPDNMLFHDPAITISEDLKHVTYDWTNKKFNLFAGDSLLIEFEASVVDYSYSVVVNCAHVKLWNCLQCPNPITLEKSDCAKVHCFPPDSVFEKKVKDPNTGDWVEEISVYVGDIVTYKMMLTYYGNDDFSDISILDELHCTMDYEEGSAIPPETEISGNLIWWNFSGPLNDSQTIEIEFNSKAVSSTGCGAGANVAIVTAYENNIVFEDSDTANVKVYSNFPPFPPDITGDTEGFEGDELKFKVITLDFDDDQIFYMFDWGDGTYSDWDGPYDSGEELKVTKSWDNAGIYNVRAKAKDISLGDESGWSFYPVEVKIDVPPVPSINIVFKPGFGLSVSAKVTNTGEVDFKNVYWNLTVKRTGLIQKTLLEKDGVIYDFPIGKTANIVGEPSGIGMIRVTLDVKAAGIDPVVFSVEGFIFSRLVYIK